MDPFLYVIGDELTPIKLDPDLYSNSSFALKKWFSKVNLPVARSTDDEDGSNDFPKIGSLLVFASNDLVLILLPPIALYNKMSTSSVVFP